jgi:hypothetical protein
MAPQTRERSSIALLVGLAMVGLVMGYMTGGSATPVVGAVIPAIGALGTLGLEFLKSRAAETRRDQLKDALATTSSEKDKATLAAAMAAEPPARTTARDIGFALIAISVGFFLGSLGGSYARTHDLFAPKHTQAPLPWEKKSEKEGEWDNKKCPLTTEAMMRFVLLRRDLAAMGYSPQQAATILGDTTAWCAAPSFVAPWESERKFATATATTPEPGKPGAEAPPTPRGMPEGVKASGRCVINANGAAQFAALREYLMLLGFGPDAANRVYEESPDRWCPDIVGVLPDLVRQMRQDQRLGERSPAVERVKEVAQHYSPYAE